MLYAINASGRLFLFTGNIHSIDYEYVEHVASDIFCEEARDEPGLYTAKLRDALLSEGICLSNTVWRRSHYKINRFIWHVSQKIHAVTIEQSYFVIWSKCFVYSHLSPTFSWE